MIKIRNLEEEAIVMVYLLSKEEMDNNREYSLQDYKVVVLLDNFYNVIKYVHLPDHCKACILAHWINEVHGQSILSWVQKEYTNTCSICI